MVKQRRISHISQLFNEHLKKECGKQADFGDLRQTFWCTVIYLLLTSSSYVYRRIKLSNSSLLHPLLGPWTRLKWQLVDDLENKNNIANQEKHLSQRYAATWTPWYSSGQTGDWWVYSNEYKCFKETTKRWLFIPQIHTSLARLRKQPMCLM